MNDFPTESQPQRLPQELPHDPGETMGMRSFATMPSAPGEAEEETQLGVASEAVTKIGLVSPPSSSPYTLRQLIGRGGMGEVWDAVQESLGRPVAIKRIRRVKADADDRAQQASAFRHEARINGRLEHPNIVPVHDLGADEHGLPLLAMKLVQGRAWDVMLKEDFPRMSAAELLAKHLPILVRLAQAVAFAHSRRIIHRDIKPSQAMVGEFGEVLLMDWGLAIAVGEQEDPEWHHQVVRDALCTTSSASSPSGTPAFMAPEQTESSAARTGPHTDVYLLGATLYYLLTAMPPHLAATSAMSFERAASGVVVPPSQRAGGREVPPDLERLCLRAMEKNPEDRHRTAQEFLSELEDYLSGASRRQESEEICRRAARVLDDPAAGYAKVSHALTEVSRARFLWPDNPEAMLVEDRLLHASANLALENGDLVLARTEAELIRDDVRKASTFLRVIKAEERARLLRLVRNASVVSAFVLLIVAITGGTVLTNRMREERDRANDSRAEELKAKQLAEERREKAVLARGEAQGLVDFMLTDLQRELLPRDPQLHTLGDAALRSLDYYARRATAALSPEESRDLAQRLTSLHRVFLVQGNGEAAGSALGVAAALTEALSNQEPQVRSHRLELLKLRQLQGDLVRAGGDGGRYFEMLRAQLQLVDGWLRDFPRDADLRRERARVLLALGVAANEQLLPDGVSHLLEAVTISEALIQEGYGDRDTLLIIAAAQSALARQSMLAGQHTRAAQHADAAVEQWRMIVALDSDAAQVRVHRRNLVEALLAANSMQFSVSADDASVTLLEEAVQQLRLLHQDPDSARDDAFALGNALVTLASQHAQRGDHESALAAVQECMAVLRSLVDGEPADLGVRVLFGNALQATAVTLAELRRCDEAATAGSEAAQFADVLAEDLGDDADWVARRIIHRLGLASAVAECGSAESARGFYYQAWAIAGEELEQRRSQELIAIASECTVVAMVRLADLEDRLGSPEAALDWIERARRESESSNPDSRAPEEAEELLFAALVAMRVHQRFGTPPAHVLEEARKAIALSYPKNAGREERLGELERWRVVAAQQAIRYAMNVGDSDAALSFLSDLDSVPLNRWQSQESLRPVLKALRELHSESFDSLFENQGTQVRAWLDAAGTIP